MKRMFRYLSMFICVCLFSISLAGCDKKEVIQEDDSISIYATFYPLYAAAEWLTDGVENVRINCLVQPQDGCLRDYQLSDWDLALLNSADLILAGGRGLESFESVLYALGEDGPAVSAVLYNMELVEQRAVNTQEDTQSHWLNANPHIYMRIDGMAEIVHRIANTLILFDSENEAAYRKNLETTLLTLDAFQTELDANLAQLKNQKVIVMNETLVYGVQDYGLEADLFYERESGANLHDADLEACLNALKKSDAQVVLIEKQAPQTLCEALEAAGYSVARMDTLSTRRASEGADGYFEAQRANAQAILDAFANLPVKAGE